MSTLTGSTATRTGDTSLTTHGSDNWIAPTAAATYARKSGASALSAPSYGGSSNDFNPNIFGTGAPTVSWIDGDSPSSQSATTGGYYSYESITFTVPVGTAQKKVELFFGTSSADGTSTWSASVSDGSSSAINGNISANTIGTLTIHCSTATDGQTLTIVLNQGSDYRMFAGLATSLESLSITSQPTDGVANEGGTISFSVSATAASGSLSYQWKKDTGSGFANTGTNSSSFTLTTNAQYSDNNTAVEVVVSDSLGPVTSNIVYARVAFRTTGTGPRSVPGLGGMPFASGPMFSLTQGTLSSGTTYNVSVSESGSASETDSVVVPEIFPDPD